MTVSAHDVAREVRKELPDVGAKKLHKLLYLCQGHHLAMTGAALFSESLHAFDMGPVVRRLWGDEHAGRDVPPVDLDEAALNTVVFVTSRYGSLTGRDLEILSHGQEPWIVADQARRRGGSDVVSPETMRLFFVGSLQDPEAEAWPSDGAIEEWLRETGGTPPDSARLDDLERLRRRASGA